MSTSLIVPLAAMLLVGFGFGSGHGFRQTLTFVVANRLRAYSRFSC